MLFTHAARRLASRLCYSEYGVASEVVKLEHFDETVVAKNDQVIVQMLAAPVNPADINVIQGTYPIKPPLPAIGGGEGVGKVVAVGHEVKNFNLGDWVIPANNATGTWTTHLHGQAKDFVKVRQDISVASAATLKINPATAYRMLHDFTTLHRGDVVVQNGANSGVGTAVIQIANHLGLVTVNVIRDRENVDELKEELTSLGADHVWTEDELRKNTHFRHQQLPRAKLALNCIGGQSSTELTKCLDFGATHVTYGGMSLKPVTVATSSLIFKDVSLRGFWLSKWIEQYMDSPLRTDMYEELAEMAYQGQLRPPHRTHAHLEDHASVLEESTKGYKVGKFIFDMH